MSILVTGASGFIGSAVVKALVSQGEEVIGFDVKPPATLMEGSFVEGSVLNKELLIEVCREYAVDGIIHLAALLQFGCNHNPDRAIEINVGGSMNLLEIARSESIKNFVFASSSGVYGPAENEIDENTPIYPGVSLYGTTKHIIEVAGFRYAELYNISFTALRFWGVYGPGEVSSPGVAMEIKKIESSIKGVDVVVNGVGAEDKRQFTYVEDAASAAILALKTSSMQPRMVNIAGGEESYVSFGDFYKIIKKMYPAAGSVLFSGKGQNRGKVDITAARKILGYEPRVTLEMGIKEIITSMIQ